MRRHTLHRRVAARTVVMSIGLIVLSLTIVGSVLAVNLLQKPMRFDPETLCQLDAPLDYHTVILVDPTDRFNADQAARVRATILEERAALPKLAKFTVLLINPDKPFEPKPIVSLCNPGSGKSANAFFSNPGQIQALWDQKFAAPIDAAIDQLLNQPSASRSPILQAITAATWRSDFDSRIPHRRLIVASDTLQHEPNGGYSHYRSSGDLWKAFLRSPIAAQVQADLTNVSVKISLLHRPEALQYQTQAQRQFWLRWFQERGANSIDFGTSADGLNPASPSESRSPVVKNQANAH